MLWSDIPGNRMLRWSQRDGMSVWRNGVEFTNGHTREANGDLLHCSHGLRAIVRTRAGGCGIDALVRDEIVVDRFGGRRLNSPNDVVVRSDGTIWFTDPPYGIASDREGHKAPSEQVANHVFCYDPQTGQLHAASAAADGGLQRIGLLAQAKTVLYVGCVGSITHRWQREPPHSGVRRRRNNTCGYAPGGRHIAGLARRLAC